MTFSFHSCELDNDDAPDQLGIRFRGWVQRGRGREEEEERGGGDSSGLKGYQSGDNPVVIGGGRRARR